MEVFKHAEIDSKGEHSVILKYKLNPVDYNLVAITNNTKEYALNEKIKSK